MASKAFTLEVLHQIAISSRKWFQTVLIGKKGKRDFQNDMLVGMFLTFQSCRSSKEMCIEFSGCRKAFDLIRLGTFSQGQAESVLGT